MLNFCKTLITSILRNQNPKHLPHARYEEFTNYLRLFSLFHPIKPIYTQLQVVLGGSAP